jgi:hypothetical protein
MNWALKEKGGFVSSRLFFFSNSDIIEFYHVFPETLFNFIFLWFKCWPG